MERESTENRAGRIVSRRRVNPIFPVPPIRASCTSLFFVLPLSRLSVCSESPLLRISPHGRISLYSYRILYSGGVGFLTQNLPPSVPAPVGGRPRWWRFCMGPALRGLAFYSTSLGAAPVNFVQYHILTAEDTSHRKISRLVSRLHATLASVRFICPGFIFIFDSRVHSLFLSFRKF